MRHYLKWLKLDGVFVSRSRNKIRKYIDRRSNMPKYRKCALCMQWTECRKCKGCRKKHYCSRKCQKLHWKIHRQMCIQCI